MRECLARPETMPKAATDVFANGGWVLNPDSKAEESFLKVSVSVYDDKTATVKMPDGAEQQAQCTLPRNSAQCCAIPCDSAQCADAARLAPQLPREDISPANPEGLTTQDLSLIHI